MKSRRTFLLMSASTLAVSAACSDGATTATPQSVSPPPPPAPPPSPPAPPPPPSPSASSLLDQIGPLDTADANGVRLATGFTSRIVAESGSAPVSRSSYIWHPAPDGGAIFATSTGGWIYVSNSEVSNTGGVGALVFDADGNVIDAYSILENTDRNCAGGTTPWNTWLSCGEVDAGYVWECDPFGVEPAIRRDALGVFKHEAAAVDLTTNIIYMTEDERDGGFYRFIPDAVDANGVPNLNVGELQIASVNAVDDSISWIKVPDPTGAMIGPTREQVALATPFARGEGIAFANGIVSFATTSDERIWAYDVVANVLSIVYERATSATPFLAGVDNIGLSLDGELIIAEDGDDLQIVAITASGRLVPLIQLVGHDSSKITGPFHAAQ